MQDNQKPMTIGEEVIDLFKSSTLIQGVITLMIIATSMVLYLNGKDVPEDLKFLVAVTVAFYFGSKSTFNTSAALDRVTKAIQANNL